MMEQQNANLGTSNISFSNDIDFRRWFRNLGENSAIVGDKTVVVEEGDAPSIQNPTLPLPPAVSGPIPMPPAIPPSSTPSMTSTPTLTSTPAPTPTQGKPMKLTGYHLFHRELSSNIGSNSISTHSRVVARAWKDLGVEDQKKWCELGQAARQEEQSFLCPKCDKTFDKMNKFKFHQKFCGQQFGCSVCEKSFKTPETLRRHENEHTAKFQCNVCQKVFTTASNMNRHLLLHSGGGVEHPCTSCNKKFSTKNNLEVHQKKFH